MIEFKKLGKTTIITITSSASITALIGFFVYNKYIKNSIPKINIEPNTLTRMALIQTMKEYKNNIEANKGKYKYSSFDTVPSSFIDALSMQKINYLSQYSENGVSFPLRLKNGNLVSEVMMAIYECIKKNLPAGVNVGVSQSWRPIWEQIQDYLNGASELLPDSLSHAPSHIYGLAVDFTIYQNGWKPDLDYTYRGYFNMCYQKYKDYVIWGGQWKHFKDYPHFQIKFDMLDYNTRENILKERKRIVAQFKSIYNQKLQDLQNIASLP